MSGASPYAFVFFDRNANVAGIDTLYYADDSSLASGGGIQKWTFDGVNWTQEALFISGLSAGVRGLAAEAVGAHVVLYATISEPSANHLLHWVDDGSPTPFAIVIATAPVDPVYRRVTLAWTAPVLDVIFRDSLEMTPTARSRSLMPPRAHGAAAGAAQVGDIMRELTRPQNRQRTHTLENGQRQ